MLKLASIYRWKLFDILLEEISETVVYNFFQEINTSKIQPNFTRINFIAILLDLWQIRLFQNCHENHSNVMI